MPKQKEKTAVITARSAEASSQAGAPGLVAYWSKEGTRQGKMEATSPGDSTYQRDRFAAQNHWSTVSPKCCQPDSKTESEVAQPQISTGQLIRWLTGITKPVHLPLLFSAGFRIINLLLDMVLFGLAGGGLLAVLLEGSQVVRIFTWLVIVAILKACCYYLEQFLGHFVAFKALELLRTYVFSTLWPKAPAIITHAKSGDLLASLTRDIDRIEVFYAHTFAPLVAAYTVPGIAIIATGTTLSWPVVSVVALCVALSLTVVPFAGFKSALKATQHTLQLRRGLTHQVTDSVFGRLEVIGYGQQDQRLAQLAQIDQQIACSANRSARILASRRAVNLLLMGISVISVVFFGFNAGYSPVLVAALVGGALRLFEGPRGVEDAVGYLDHSFASARRLWQISCAPQQVQDGPQHLRLDHAPSVSWKDVSYAYRDREGKPTGFALKGINIQAPAGKHTVIMGASGSGKSTAVKLLVRYDDPDQGQICLDDQPVDSFSLDSLRTSVVVVSQDNQLLNTSVAQNLRLGQPNASDQDLWRVLELVGMDREVQVMPAGLETAVGNNGSALSGGQVQRLCLARALVQRPKILVLDEFTSHLDPGLEDQVRRSIKRGLPGATIIEITHRASAIAQSDQVIVLDQGKEVSAT